MKEAPEAAERYRLWKGYVGYDARRNLRTLRGLHGKGTSHTKGPRKNRFQVQPTWLDSAMVVYVMMDLEEKLVLELSTDDFQDHPTIDELSRYLAKKRATRPAE